MKSVNSDDREECLMTLDDGWDIYDGAVESGRGVGKRVMDTGRRVKVRAPMVLVAS